MIVNRRLNADGRNITFRGRYNYTNSNSDLFSISETEYFQQTVENRLEILNRYITTPTKTSEYNARLTYSEPIFKGGFIQFSYNFQYKHSKPTIRLSTCLKIGKSKLEQTVVLLTQI